MYLKGLELFGFKSFADRVKMEIEPGITGIVGPNGSGKSNIVEAIKWVLGEQSAKSLRGQKMEDLIFNGTKKRKALGLAEISLILDNSDGFLPLEYTDIRVTRRLYRSGDSEYLLNGKNCRLKDILRLFADTGIGDDGYAIIGQGRITEILAAKPDERRGIIEETAGIVRYRERKREALRKMNQADQNILRIEDIILEIGSRLGPLKGEAEAAEAYLAYKKEMDELEIGFLAEAILDGRERRGELEEKLSAETGRGQEITGAILAKETALSEKKALLLASEDENGTAQGRHQALKQSLQALEGEVETLASRIMGYDEKMELLETEMTAFKEKGRDREQMLRDEESRYQQLENERARQMEALAAIEEKRLLEEEDLVKSEQALEHMREEAFEMARETGNKKNRHLSLMQSKEGGLQRMRNMDDKIKKYEEENAFLRERAGEIEYIAKSLEEKVKACNQKEDELAAKEEAVRKEIADCRNNLAAEQMALHQTEARLKILEELELKREGFYPGIKAILAEKSKGSFPGIIGVIAEVIQVSPAHATAIETVLGGALQNIVTADSDEARRAIAFLKEGKRGNATFLPLDMLRIPEKLVVDKIKDLPGFIGIGAELVHAPLRVKPAVEFLLNHTIVVENLEQAIAISRAYRRPVRYVTLDGDIIYGGGSISGGSRNQGKGGLLSRKSEIESLRRSLLAAEAREAGHIRRNEELEAGREKLKQDKDKQGIKRREIEGELSTYRGEIKNISLREEFFDREIESLVLEKAQIEDVIGEEEEKLAQLLEEIATAEKEEAALLTRLEQMEQELKEAKRSESEVRTAHTKIQVELAAVEKDWENCLGNMARLTEEKTLQEGDFAAKEKLLHESLLQKETANDKIAEIKNKILEKGKEIAASDQELIRLGQEKEALRGDILLIEKELKILRLEEDANKEQCHQLELKRERLLADEAQQEEKLFEQYQCSVEKAAAFIRDDISKREKQQRIVGLRRSIAVLGQVNIGAIREFAEVSERYQFLVGQRDDMAEARESLGKLVSQMDEIIVDKFKETFDKINESFQVTFPEFFQGGYGELLLTEPENLLETGVDIIVQPPGKRLQHHGLLSGGEKSLCGIALLFAILKVKPSPFYVLDEIDAALDDINVRRFAAYLERYSQESQFLVITHRQGTMESAGELYGITMEEEGVSKTVSVKLVG